MTIDTSFFRRCLRTLGHALEEFGSSDTDDVAYDVYRAACVKAFELALDQSGKLLRKRLAEFFSSNRQADRLAFKDLFRHACLHALIQPDAVERWLGYRDNRDDTTLDYSEDLDEATLKLLPGFIADATALANAIDGVRQ